MSENSIKFSLSNSEQRDSWLNFGHWTLDADTATINALVLGLAEAFFIMLRMNLEQSQGD